MHTHSHTSAELSHRAFNFGLFIWEVNWGKVPKGEVSYVHWVNKVKNTHDDHPAAVLKDSMVKSLRNNEYDIVRYLGLKATVMSILNKLEQIYGMVASYDILMHNFFHIIHMHNERVSGYITRLKGSLRYIRIEHPSRILEQDAQRHLREFLFHGM